MKTKKLVIPALGSAILLLGSASALAAKPAVPSKTQTCRCQMRYMHFKRQLQKLTPQQQATVKQLISTTRQKLRPTRELLSAKSAELRAALLEPKLNQKRISELENRISALRTELFKARVNLVVQVKQQTGLLLPHPRMHRR